MKARQMDKAVRQLVFDHGQNLKAVAHNKKVQAREEKEKELVIEKVTENVLVNIPDRIPYEELPALLSAMYYYVKEAQTKAAAWSSMRKGYKKELTLNLMASCYSSDIQELVTKLLEIPVFIPGQTPVRSDQYDMYCTFDPQIMRTFKENGKFHASSAYGIMLGCEAQSLFDIPVARIIKNVEARETVNILVIDDALYNYKQTWQWIGETVTRLKVSRIIPYMNRIDAIIAAIDGADLIVGPTSLYTYLACCMRKPVFEIYPPGVSRSWLSKWSNPLYAMYVSSPEKLDKNTLLRGVSLLWAKHLQVVQSKLPVPSAPIPEQTQTAPLQ